MTIHRQDHNLQNVANISDILRYNVAMIETLGQAKIYTCPALTTEDMTVLGAIHDMRLQLSAILRTPRRWTGGLRRTMLARAIRGSNSIEGYIVDDDDAAAAVDDDEPLTADEQTFAEIRGYRQALGYVLQMADDPHFTFDTTGIRGMHYMMLAHDLKKGPGKYRPGPIYVVDEKTGLNVYEGPDANQVPDLMDSFTASLRVNAGVDPIAQAAMAHLNLVMIHPFRDGNGRMARALQTFVLSRQAIAEPFFSSIEEWLGANTDDYYRVLALTGNGSWSPRGDAHMWLSFNLRAHHMQAQTLARRIEEASAIWKVLDEYVLDFDLPARVAELLYEAAIGYRLRRSSYMKSADVEDRTASRDLARLTDLGLLLPSGVTRARTYVAGEVLLDLRLRVRDGRKPIQDPYPWMKAALLKAEQSRNA
jgi:Fic family protein